MRSRIIADQDCVCFFDCGKLIKKGDDVICWLSLGCSSPYIAHEIRCGSCPPQTSNAKIILHPKCAIEMGIRLMRDGKKGNEERMEKLLNMELDELHRVEWGA